MPDEVHPIWRVLLDFQSAMMAGSGMSSLPGDPRLVAFGQRLESGEFANSGLANVASNLMENVHRLDALAHMPMEVFNYGRRFQEVYSKFISEPAKVESPSMSEDQIRHFQAERRVWAWILGNESHESDIGSITSLNDVAGFAVAPQTWGPHYDERRSSQISSFVSSILIQAWSSFESLSEDLWEAAINFHPTILGELKGKPRSKFRAPRSQALAQPQGQGQPTGSQTAESNVRMSFDDLQINQFNVRSKMGTILKRRGDIAFRSIYDIRESYHRAFRDQSKDIDDVLDDPKLQYAAAVRNLLIHKGGIVDKEFRNQVSLVPEVPVVNDKERFPLTGKLCAELSDTCRTCSMLLTNLVHAWIIGHPENLDHE